MSRRLHLAHADGHESKSWKRTTTTWEDVCGWVKDPRTGPKAGPCFVLGELSSSLRRKDTLVSRSALTLDADKLTPESFDALLADLRAAGWDALVWTTHSHTAEAPRLRVLILTDRDLTPDEYRLAAREVMDRLGPELFDSTCSQPERLMYDPTVPKQGGFRSWVLTGEPLPVDAVLLDARLNAPEPATERHEMPLSRPEVALPEDYVREHVKRTLRDLDKFAGLPEGVYMPWPTPTSKLRGWDGLYLLAMRLVEAANSGTTYTLDEARADFIEHAPPAEGTYNPVHKWDSAVKLVGGKPLPYDDPAADFEPVSGDEPSADDPRERAIREELERLLVRDEAHRRFEALRRPPATPWDAGTLTEHLEKPQPPAARVEGLVPWSASTAVIAQRKTGKTTLVLNLARCLLTGADFLGRPVRKVSGRVALLNFEVSGPQIAAWADEARVPHDGLFVVNLRGASNPFGDPARLAELGALLRSQNVESLIVDPFGRAYAGESQNDAGEVQRWLLALDEFARGQVGALDVLLAVHAGWNGERARGSSALEDWADALFYLTRDEDTGDRYLRVEGRDVELDEDRLVYDAQTRALSLAGVGSRKQAKAGRKADELVQAVVSLVEQSPGLKAGEVEAELREAGFHLQKGEGSRAARVAVSQGLLRSEPGARNAVHYHPVSSSTGGTK